MCFTFFEIFLSSQTQSCFPSHFPPEFFQPSHADHFFDTNASQTSSFSPLSSTLAGKRSSFYLVLTSDRARFVIVPPCFLCVFFFGFFSGIDFFFPSGFLWHNTPRFHCSGFDFREAVLRGSCEREPVSFRYTRHRTFFKPLVNSPLYFSTVTFQEVR